MKAPIDVAALLDVIVQSISVVLVFILGALNPQIGYFFLGLLVDVALGTIVSIKRNKFSKKYLICKTLEKFVIYTLLIFFGHAIDVVGNLKDQIRNAILLGLLIKEGFSLIPKLKALGYKEEAAILEENLPKSKSERGEKD